MVTKSGSAIHDGLVEDLSSWLSSNQGVKVTAVDLPGKPQPMLVENPGNVGDGENKRPDIDGRDQAGIWVRGEAKTGLGDIGTPHSRTQYLLFANRETDGTPSWLYIIVPSSKMVELKAVLRELRLLDRPNVIPVRSGKYQ